MSSLLIAVSTVIISRLIAKKLFDPFLKYSEDRLLK